MQHVVHMEFIAHTEAELLLPSSPAGWAAGSLPQCLFVAALSCCLCSRAQAARTWFAVYLVSLQVCHELGLLTCSKLCQRLLLLPCSSPVEVSKTCDCFSFACSSCTPSLVPYRYVTYWLEVTKTHIIAPPRPLRINQLVLRGLPQNLVHHAAITLGSRAVDGSVQPAAQYVFSLQPRNDLKLGERASSLAWPVI